MTPRNYPAPRPPAPPHTHPQVLDVAVHGHRALARIRHNLQPRLLNAALPGGLAVPAWAKRALTFPLIVSAEFTFEAGRGVLRGLRDLGGPGGDRGVGVQATGWAAEQGAGQRVRLRQGDGVRGGAVPFAPRQACWAALVRPASNTAQAPPPPSTHHSPSLLPPGHAARKAHRVVG